MKNLKLSTKLIAAFLIVAFIVLVVGFFGYGSIQRMQDETGEIVEAAPLVDAAKEMKLAVALDLRLIMEFLESRDQSALDALWQEHEKEVESFDTYADAIVNGANTNVGKVYATKDDRLRALVVDADRFHNTELQPSIKGIYDLISEDIVNRKELAATMDAFEDAYDEIFDETERLESMVKQRIEERADKGVSANSLFKKENTWADMSMELKATLANSRISVEEYTQAMETDASDDIKMSYHEANAEMETWLNALLNGATTDEGRIARVDVRGIRAVVESIKDRFTDGYLPLANRLIELQEKHKSLVTDKLNLDERADEIGMEMMGILSGVENGAREVVAEANENSKQIASSSTTQTLVGIVVGFILAIVLGIFFTRRIVDPINRIIVELRGGASHVSGASDQLSSSSQSLAEGASEQASYVEETSASVEEITSMVKQNADNAMQANDVAKDARSAAENGADSVGSMIMSMDDINRSSEEVSNIIKVINEIAFQTNLLALNAAVEAARAGEHGKGFAVVAEEVRNLARRSAEAARETEGLIEGSVNKVKDGSKLAEEAGKALETIVKSNKRVEDLIGEISAASKEQSDGLGQIAAGMGQMEWVIQQISSSSEESAASAEELSAQSDGLMGIVISLVSVVGGNGKNGAIAATGKELDKKKIPYKAEIDARGDKGKGDSVKPKKLYGSKKTFEQGKAEGEQKKQADKLIPMDEDEFREF